MVEDTFNKPGFLLGLRDRSDQSDKTDRTKTETKTKTNSKKNGQGQKERWYWLNSEDSIVRANTLICLIHQANYLLDLQIDSLEAQFIEAGGYSEALATKRIEHRNQQKAEDQNYPPCPQCGGTLVLRTARSGPNAGEQFLGCSNYPQCKGSHKL